MRAVTPKQLEKKAKQLLHRRKLADTVEALEESIKTHLQVENKAEVLTKNFIIKVDRGEILVSLLPKVDLNQLNLKFRKEVIKK